MVFVVVGFFVIFNKFLMIGYMSMELVFNKYGLWFVFWVCLCFFLGFMMISLDMIVIWYGGIFIIYIFLRIYVWLMYLNEVLMCLFIFRFF